VDRVHGDGEMRTVAVRRTRSRIDAGEYAWHPADGEPHSMSISIYSDHPHLTIAHEIGHFLDQHALGQQGRFASATGRVPTIMEAIERSTAVHALRALVGRQTTLVEVRPGRRERHRLAPAVVEYLLRPEEMFARAYAQYIARRSGQRELLAELAGERAALLSGRVYHTQWADEDFATILETFDRLLAEKGWT
jgi:hypothetical protein